MVFLRALQMSTRAYCVRGWNATGAVLQCLFPGRLLVCPAVASEVYKLQYQESECVYALKLTGIHGFGCAHAVPKEVMSSELGPLHAVVQMNQLGSLARYIGIALFVFLCILQIYNQLDSVFPLCLCSHTMW